MRFPFALTKKIASHIIKHKLRKTPRFAMVLQLEPLHTCNLTCTGCGRIREYSTASRTWCRWKNAWKRRWNAMRRWCQHLRRRTADLSEDRGARRRLARARPRHLHLHERHVHAEENAGLPGGDLFAGRGAETQKAARGKIDFRQGRRNDPQVRRGGAPKGRHPSDEMDVLERPRGRSRIHA